jgi:glutathione synthase/RimK-type ligase-like ATP-grasp enzyme
MPAFDLVFNAIADPDVGLQDLGAAERFLRDVSRPILNPPSKVPETRRDRLKALLEGIESTIVPETRRLDSAALEEFAASGTSGPFLLRTAGTHGGDDLARIERAQEALDYAELRPAEFYYLSHFFDYRNGDGHYRKYRLIFIDRKVYPYHLAIMEDWKVHYFRADMAEDAWKRAEEARFLEDYRSVFGAAGARALTAIAERIDLDYAGIDCARLDDGRVLVFEANPAMLVHLDDREIDFPYKHRFVPRIQAAMSALILKRAED